MTKQNKQVQTGEVKLEDYMKSVLVNADKLDPKIIIENLTSFLEEKAGTKNFILLSEEGNYYQVFRNESGAEPAKVAEFIFDFLKESFFFNDKGQYNALDDVREIENSLEIEGLDIWIGTTYFQLNPYDWGVEII